MDMLVESTFIVVTNYQAGAPVVGFDEGDKECNTVILRQKVLGRCVVPCGDDKDMFTVDTNNQVAMAKWGMYGPLSREEAQRLGGDFGIWFSS